MRARNLKPGFFKNEVLASLPPLCRILYEGLWCYADRDGRFEDRPLRIKAEILPYDNCDVEIFLKDLQKHEFINRYSVNGSNYIEIPNFKKHQNPHIKEGDSTIPAPELHKKNTKRTRCLSGVKTPSSLIPSSLIPDSLYTAQFEVFWKSYPKKIGKGYAKKIFLKVTPSEELLKKMIEKINLFKGTEQWQKDGGQFIPHPATWLNQGRWEDEIEENKPKIVGDYRKARDVLREQGFPDEAL